MKSSFGWRIPKVSKNTNILRVRMTNYGTTIPQLNYVHIGSCLKNASYTTKEFESEVESVYHDLNDILYITLIFVNVISIIS